MFLVSCLISTNLTLNIIYNLIIYQLKAVPQVPRNNDQLISNRRETTIEEFSYLVSITAWNFHICTGIILNQNTILTTVSCTQ